MCELPSMLEVLRLLAKSLELITSCTSPSTAPNPSLVNEALLAHLTEEESKAESRSRLPRFTMLLWQSWDSNLSGGGRQGLLPASLQCLPSQHNTPAANPPSKAHRQDAGHTQDTPAHPQPPARGQVESRCSINVCRMNKLVHQKTGPVPEPTQP